jgi:hypothetical protein
LLVQAQDGHSSIMALTNSAENFKPADKTKLVFKKYRDQYFLAEIWTAGSIRGRRLPKSNREKELELAQDLQHQRVEIVASLY